MSEFLTFVYRKEDSIMRRNIKITGICLGIISVIFLLWNAYQANNNEIPDLAENIWPL